MVDISEGMGWYFLMRSSIVQGINISPVTAVSVFKGITVKSSSLLSYPK